MGTVLGILFMIVCVLLIIVILLQKGRGGGLGAAFGGGGQSAFGTRTGDVFTWITIVLTGLFLLLAILTSVAIRPEQKPLSAPVIVPTAAAARVDANNMISVQISSAEKTAELWYTTNGDDPVPRKEGTSQFGTHPILVKPGTMVKAIAVRAGRKDSPIATVQYLTEAEQEAARDAAIRQYLENLPPVSPEPESTGPGATERPEATTESDEPLNMDDEDFDPETEETTDIEEADLEPVEID